MTAIGDFRHRLTLQAADEIEDGAGGVTRTWETLGQCWAAIEPLSLDDKLLGEPALRAPDVFCPVIAERSVVWQRALRAERLAAAGSPRTDEALAEWL